MNELLNLLRKFRTDLIELAKADEDVACEPNVVVVCEIIDEWIKEKE